MLNKRLIIGLGTGRSGSWSLTKFLGKQRDAHVTHEASFLPWKPYWGGAVDQINSILRREESLVGDVGFYYLNYVDYILQMVPTAKLVCLQRSKPATVDSWMKQSGRANHWTELDSIHWRKSDLFTNNSFYFPKYDLPKKLALDQYWEDYYKKARKWQRMYPKSFRIFRMEALNTVNEMNNILAFVGVPIVDRVLEQCHYNRKDDMFVDHEKMPIKVGTCEFCRKPDCAEWYVRERKFGVVSYACDDCKQNGDLGVFNKEVK